MSPLAACGLAGARFPQHPAPQCPHHPHCLQGLPPHFLRWGPLRDQGSPHSSHQWDRSTPQWLSWPSASPVGTAAKGFTAARGFGRGFMLLRLAGCSLGASWLAPGSSHRSASLPRDSVCLAAPFLRGGNAAAASAAHRAGKDGDFARALLRNAAAFWQALSSFPAQGYVALGQGDVQELGPDGFCR